MDNTQGDKKFLNVLEQLGCKVTDTAKGICVEGPEHGNIHGIDIDMNDFSDQTMTLARWRHTQMHRCTFRTLATSDFRNLTGSMRS